MKYEKAPLEIILPAPNGNYEVNVTLTAEEDTVFSILSQSRRFMAHDVYIKKGETKDITFIANVCDYHKHGEEFTNVKNIEVYILCDGNLRATAAASPVDVPTIYIAGDSTVTDQPAEYPYIPSSTYCGWGQMFPMFLDTKTAVSNHAQSGSTTQEFMDTNFLAFKDKIKPGDVLIVEFGHNDQKIKELDAFGGYAKNLRYYVEFAKSKGAYPILNSSINRIIFEPDGTLKNLLGEYRNAVKSVADEFSVPFIDLWSRTTEYFETAGPVKSWQFFRCKGEDRDYTHTNDIGGELIAKITADEIVKNKISPIFEHVKKDMIKIEQVIADKDDVANNAKEAEHLKTIGLVNVPEDFDKDIRNI